MAGRRVSRPPGTKNIDLTDLRARAKKVAAESRSKVMLTFGVHPAIFKKLVETAEQYGRPTNDVARICLEYGLERYKTLRTEFQPVRMTDALPEIGQDFGDEREDVEDFRAAATGGIDYDETRDQFAGMLPRSAPQPKFAFRRPKGLFDEGQDEVATVPPTDPSLSAVSEPGENP